jgi:aspartate aminotransferase-like enzyme
MPVVQEALGRPIIHARTDEFRTLFKECLTGLQSFLRTSNEVLILAASGSGAMEAAAVNLVAPGERVLALVAGNFGERWAQIGRAHGMDVRVLEASWGEAVPPADVERALAEEPEARAVFVQHSESSTGVKHDIERLAAVVRQHGKALLIVDAISGAGAMPLETDGWGVDVVVGGSQKTLSLPPGLAFLSLGPRALERIDACPSPRFYFDLRRERKGQAEGTTAYTPAISHIVALKAALDFVESIGGVQTMVRNAGTLAAMTRAAAGALGVPLLAPRDYGDALTALYPPEGIEAPAIVKALKEEFAATVAGGQGKLKGKIFRIAHLGYYDAVDALGVLGALEVALSRLGHEFEPGCGVAAAQREYLRRNEAGGGK